MNKRKKKKGFTLIELIAVIAILAILGVILVPKIGGYTAKASAAKDLANAKQLLQAVEMYNQDSTHESSQIDGDVTITSAELGPYTTWPSVLPKTATTTIKGADLLKWDGMTYSNLKKYAEELEAEQK